MWLQSRTVRSTTILKRIGSLRSREMAIVEDEMSSLTEEQAKAHITKLLTAMSKAGGSDLFVSKDFPPSMKLQSTMRPLTRQKLTGGVTRNLANSLMNQRQRDDF